MQKIFYLIFLSVGLLWSIEIDVPYIQNSLKENPHDINNRLLLAKYYLQNKKYTNANTQIKRVLKEDPKNPIANRLKDKLDKGLKLQKLLPNIDLTNTKEIENTLISFEKNNKCTKLIKSYKLLQELYFSLNKTIHLAAVNCYLKKGDIKTAEHIARKYLKNKEIPLSLQTLIAVQDNDLYKAKTLLNKLKKESPSNPLIPKAEDLIQSKEQKLMKDLAHKVENTNSLTSLQNYVYLLNEQKQQQKAIQTVKNFIDRNPKNTDAKIFLAQLYYWNGDPKTAFHKLYKYRKTNLQTRKLYANILYEMGDYKHARFFIYHEVLPFLKTEKEQYFFQKRLAFAYAQTQEYDKATGLLQKLRKENPKDQELAQFQKTMQKQALLRQANTLYKQKKYTEALRYFKRYYQQTKDPAIAKEIAEIYYFQEKYEEALPYFKHYLTKYPNENMIRFHYAMALEKEKAYTQAHQQFAKVTHCKDQKLCYLAKYHQSYNLMQTQKDKEWLQARKILQALHMTLEKDDQYTDLKKYTDSLLKVAQGEVRKPTYYKDIVLTEGAKKDLNPKTVFSNIDIEHTATPTLKELLDTGEQKKIYKPMASAQMNYVKDSETRYRNYKVMVKDILTVNGIRYSLSAHKYLFNFLRLKRKEGNGATLHVQKGKATFSLGLQEVEDSYMIVPQITWSPTVGIHNLYMDMYYKNGAFTNYRGCMIKNDVKVLHAGIYDRMLLENLDYAELGLNVNAYDDGNTNMYAMFSYPFYNTTLLGMEHRFLFNENIDYNTKTSVCYHPSSLYDSTYLVYNPKMQFQNGSMQLKLAKGYSFKNKENIASYGLQGDYRINNIASFELNCERIQSSFTTDDIDYCTFNIIQEW